MVAFWLNEFPGEYVKICVILIKKYDLNCENDLYIIYMDDISFSKTFNGKAARISRIEIKITRVRNIIEKTELVKY